MLASTSSVLRTVQCARIVVPCAYSRGRAQRRTDRAHGVVHGVAPRPNQTPPIDDVPQMFTTPSPGEFRVH